MRRIMHGLAVVLNFCVHSQYHSLEGILLVLD